MERIKANVMKVYMTNKLLNVRVAKVVKDWITEYAKMNEIKKYSNSTGVSLVTVANGMIHIASEYMFREYFNLPLYLFNAQYFDMAGRAFTQLRTLLGDTVYLTVHLDYRTLRDVDRISKILGLSWQMTCTFLIYFAIFETYPGNFPKEVINKYEEMMKYLELACGRYNRDNYMWKLYKQNGGGFR